MTHLTQVHAVIGIVDEEITDITTVGRMAGYAAHLPSAPLLGRIILAAQRMAFSSCSSDNMGLCTEMTVTRQTEFIYRLDQLRFILAAMRVVTGIAHPCFDRTMDKFLFQDLNGHV